MIFPWSLRDTKSPQISRTLLSIRADLNNSVVIMISARPSISRSSNPLIKPLGIVPRAPIRITIKFMFHSFYYHYYFTLLRVFQNGVWWCLHIGICVTAILLKSPGLLLAFWPIIKMLYFGWYPLVFLVPSSSVPVPVIWWLYRAHLLKLVSPSLSYSIFKKKILIKGTYLSFCLFSVLGQNYHYYLPQGKLLYIFFTTVFIIIIFTTG